MNPILEQPPIAIGGLGCVGLLLAFESSKKFDTHNFDIKIQRITELRSDQDRNHEATSEELTNSKKLQFSTALEACNWFIVIVPTLINKVNRFDLTPLVNASETVCKVLRQCDICIQRFVDWYRAYDDNTSEGMK